MIRRALFLLCLLSLVWTAAAPAGGFDCVKPPYGATISSINDNDYFVKFSEKEGVAYYNYTGPCKLGVHERLAPVIVYGAVDGKLYSRIMKTEHDDIDIIKAVTTKLAGTPQTVTEGEWLVMSWDFPEKRIKMKLKYNSASQATKSAIYYEPLRPKAAPAPEESLEK
ncbi:MAG: hypothetical protein AAGU21_14555 [Solidesulfovibrio sp.]|uniref:hypothetical protein n=1 Tax=Solidesulfovibrio sp. TaxID=2910990 RepID=UPI0031599209